MNPGPDHHERGSGRQRQPYGSESGDTGGDATFADVFNGFTFGGKRSKRGPADESSGEPEQTVRPSSPEDGDASQQGGRQAPAGRDDEDFTPAAGIRSYAWTGGRTKSNVEFELETLVSTGDGYRPGMPLRQEHQSVAQLCQQPRSVAEIGALLDVPFGVAKVLLADMAEQGLVHVHQTVTDSGSAPHMMLMERVLSGLRRL